MSINQSASSRDTTRLSQHIERTGTECEPCDCCSRAERLCIVNTDLSLRCAGCVYSKKGRYRAGPAMPTIYESIEQQQERLRQQEEEAMAKILRLRKQQEFLRNREKEMIRRDLRTLEELDLAEENERLEKEKLEKERAKKETATAVTTSIPNGSSFGFFDPSLPLLSEAELKALLTNVNTSGGMPVVS
ncbi:hypothetical protein ACHAO8_011628 [Botrytis cinerea]